MTLRRALLALVVAGVCLSLAPSALASAPSFTWAGLSTISNEWAVASNWENNSEPTTSMAIGTLTFPRLTSTSCMKEAEVDACYASLNDLSGLSVESIKFDDGDSYLLWGEEITLGSGGLSASPAAESTGSHGDSLYLPIHLSAPQTWSIAGRSGGGLGENGVGVFANLSGSANALTVEISNAAVLILRNETEVGPVAVDGANASQSGAHNGLLYLNGELNSSDANPVSLNHIYLQGSGAVGALQSSHSELGVGVGGYPAEGIEADSATFDSASELFFHISGVDTSAGKGYSQLISHGPIELGGSTLKVRVEPGEELWCPALPPGLQYTLVSTTGTLSGIFGNAPEGSEIPIEFAKNCTQVSQNMRIAYTAHSVIGTVIAAPSSTMLSVLPGGLVTNQSAMLTASVIASSGTPAGTVEFQNDGVAIPGCSAQPMTEATAVCSTEFSAAGSPEQLTAVFHPGPGVNPKESVSNTEDVTVGKGSTITTLHATAPAGDSVTYTANVTPGITGASSPSGSVEFLDGGTPIASCASQTLTGGGASCQVSYASPGTHSVTAQYLGDPNFTGSASAPQTVTATGTAPSTATSSTTTAEPGELTLSSTSITIQGTGNAAIKVDCTGTGTCSGKLTLTSTTEEVAGRASAARTKSRKRKHSKSTTIGVTTFSIPGGKTATIKLTLNSAGRALLKADHGRLNANLTIIESSAGSTSTQHASVHLVEQRAAKAKKPKKQ